MKISNGLLFIVIIFVSVANAGNNNINDFVKACGSASNIDTHICTCLAKKADERLTPDGFKFLVASFNKNKALAKELISRLKPADQMQAGMFLVNTPAECVGQPDSY